MADRDAAAAPGANDVLAAVHLPAARSSKRMPGFDATVWQVELEDGTTVAVRLLRPGIPAAREIAALRLAREHRQPAPQVLTSGSIGDRAAIVMTWCTGRPIGELLADGDVAGLATAFGRAHADLHEPVDADGNVLCHLDFRPFNVLVDDTPAVTGIVDWSNARVGDRRADIAWTRVVLDLAPAVLPDFADGVGVFRTGWRDGYASRRSMPGDDELRPFLAEAAVEQLSHWVPRADAGECPPSVVTLGRQIVEHWSAPGE